MRLTLTQEFEHPAHQVATAYSMAELYPRLSSLPKLGQPDVLSRHLEGEVVRLRIRYRFGGHLSPAAKAVVDPDRLTWVDESEHDLTARTVSFRLHPDNYANRLECHGTYRFTDDGGGGCTRHADIELRVSFPLLGSVVEQAIASGLREHLADEAPIVDAFLSETSL